MKALYGMWASVNVSECDEKHSCVPHVTWSTCLKNGTCGGSECKPLNELSQPCTLCTFAKIMMPPKTWHMNVDLFLPFTGGKDTGPSTHTHTYARTHTCAHAHAQWHVWEPLTSFGTREYEPFPFLSAYYYLYPYFWLKTSLCIQRHGSWWKHTYTIMHAYKCTCTCDEI